MDIISQNGKVGRRNFGDVTSPGDWRRRRTHAPVAACIRRCGQPCSSWTSRVRVRLGHPKRHELETDAEVGIGIPDFRDAMLRLGGHGSLPS